MKTDEANKIIAEYMGTCFIRCNQQGGFCHEEHIDYSESLDSLVPVWEKLGFFRKDEFPCFFMNGTNFYCEVMVNENMGLPWQSGEGKTIQEAACIATAKAIEELGK